MGALAPPILLLVAWVLALTGATPPGADADAGLDEHALRWILYLSVGWAGIGGGVMHTIFARPTAASIGWQTSGFQYEVGFANLGIGLAGLYAASQDISQVWVAAAIVGGTFLALAGANHVKEIIRDRNFAPGNTVILVSDFGVPISLLVLLISVGAI
jgi:hypothetical protein